MRKCSDRSSGALSVGQSQPSDAGITAVEMARLAGVGASDIHYWGKSKYLQRRGSGSSSFPLSEVPKAQLMGIFAKQLHMDAGEASRLAEQLLPLYATKPDVIAALGTLAAAVQSRIDALAGILLESDLIPELERLLEAEPPEEDP